MSAAAAATPLTNGNLPPINLLSCACSALYPKVVACLTELRTMTEEYSKQVLQIQDMEPDVISPLIMEMVSKSPFNDWDMLRDS